MPSRIASSARTEREDEWIILVGPGRNQERNQSAADGKINVDMAEVSFETFAWKMSQRNNACSAATAKTIAVPGVPTTVAIFVAQATECLRGRVPLLAGRGLVLDENLVEDFVERTQFRCGTIPSYWDGLGMLEHLPDRDS